MNVYAVRDNKLGIYTPPFIARVDAEAIRMVLAACRDPNTTVAQYPDDFSLFCVGTWDEEKGITSTAEFVPEHLGLISGFFEMLKRSLKAAELNKTEENKDE